MMLDQLEEHVKNKECSKAYQELKSIESEKFTKFLNDWEKKDPEQFHLWEKTQKKIRTKY